MLIEKKVIKILKNCQNSLINQKHQKIQEIVK